MIIGKAKFILVTLILLFVFAPLSYGDSVVNRALRIGSRINGSTSGSILFVNSLNKLAQDNANLFWDDTNNRLGVGENSPLSTFVVGGNVSIIESGDVRSDAGLTDNSLTVWSDDVATGASDYVRISHDQTDGVIDVGSGQLNFTSTKAIYQGNIGRSVFIGNNAGALDDGTNNDNVFIGEDVGSVATAAVTNVGIGFSALKNLTTGNDNVCIGANAGLNITSAFTNVAIGTASLRANTSGGINNVAIGVGALNKSTGADSNVAIGTLSQFNCTSGSNNFAFGINSLLTNTTGSSNVGIGTGSLQLSQSGNGNLAIGDLCGDNITSGAFNFLLGYRVDAQSATASNQMSLGNLIFSEGIDGEGTTVSSGNIGIGVTTPAEKLEVEDGNATTGIQISNTAADGDPFWGFALSGTRKWTGFLDDGDGDDLKINDGTISGGTTRFRIDGTDGDIQTYQGITRETDRIVGTTTLDATYHHVYCDTDGGAFPVNLPPGSDGREYRIINVGTSSNNLTIVANGSEAIIGTDSNYVLTDGEPIILVYETTEGWW